jgi:hypothetical protein
MSFIQKTSIPFTFLDSTYQLTNLTAVDQIVVQSDQVPRGFLARILDLGVVFTTTGGQVYFSRRKLGGSFTRITSNLSTSASGLAAPMLDEGERLAIQIGATGSGVIAVFADGELIPKSPVIDEIKPMAAEFYGRGSF